MSGMTNDELMERLAIRAVVDNWVLWRDAGDWERIRGVWHDDGYMMATWFQGPAARFIDASREAQEDELQARHDELLGLLRRLDARLEAIEQGGGAQPDKRS